MQVRQTVQTGGPPYNHGRRYVVLFDVPDADLEGMTRAEKQHYVNDLTHERRRAQIEREKEMFARKQ